MKYSKIGDIVFSALTGEEVRYENEVTDRPVENLGYIADHVKTKPIRFSVAGAILGADAFMKMQLLKKYREGKEVQKYIGKNIFSDVIIENLTTVINSKTENGFEFSLECKVIKRATSKESFLKLPISRTTQVRKAQNKGKKTTTTKKVDDQRKAYYRAKEKRLLEEDMRHKRSHGGGGGSWDHTGAGGSF